MDKNFSIVKVDTRPYRVIAQENWGLTDAQMKGRHVHHRIHRSDGGTNDPSNLYVCTPMFHDLVWHGDTGGFIGLATEGGKKGGASNVVNKTGFCGRTPEKMSTDGKKGGETNVANRTGFLSPEWQESKERREVNVKNGIKAKEDKSGIHSEEWLNSEERRRVYLKTGSTNGAALREQGKGIFSPEWLGSEDHLKHQSEEGKAGGAITGERCKANKTGICGQTKKELSDNAKKANSQIWESTHDGFRGNAGNVARHNKANGWDPSDRVKLG